MKKFKLMKLLIIIILIPFFVTSCKKDGKIFPGGDARENPPDPRKRVEKNIREGRGMRFFDPDKKSGGTFDFASSNELWRASLDTIDFMPLASANYSGGIIITDWYSDGSNQNESLKISIRFLTNEIRSDALDVKVFYKKCAQSINCKITETSGNIVSELKKKILKKAAVYSKETQKKSKNSTYKAPKDWQD